MKEDTAVLKALKKGIAFEEGIYSLSDPLTLHLIDALKDNEINYQNVGKAVYDFMLEMKQFDSLSMPDGSQFDSSYRPKS